MPAGFDGYLALAGNQLTRERLYCRRNGRIASVYLFFDKYPELDFYRVTRNLLQIGLDSMIRVTTFVPVNKMDRQGTEGIAGRNL